MGAVLPAGRDHGSLYPLVSRREGGEGDRAASGFPFPSAFAFCSAFERGIQADFGTFGGQEAEISFRFCVERVMRALLLHLGWDDVMAGRRWRWEVAGATCDAPTLGRCLRLVGVERRYWVKSV